MKELPQTYNHQTTEKNWQQHWLNEKTYRWDESASRAETYVIDTPPPTVSGTLHMGHIFSYTQADFIARFQRMAGKTVFYPMGFDDNGLPTERLVEKVKKVRATDMSREAFIELCEGVAEEARIEFRDLFVAAALSVDWDQEYHTISEDSRRMSQMSFLDLFNKDRAYRKLQPMLWDPVDQTAIAQAEVEDKELPSFFTDIAFGLEGSAEEIVIGTTRPEMLPACVAVLYHPEDERYTHLAGKAAITPLFGAKVPLLADDMVKIDKGTGLVMCCTFGDETDIAWWRKHNLPTKIILNKYGKLDLSEYEQTDEIAALHNLKAVTAREKVLELLKLAGLIRKQESITHAVKCAERSGAALEILPTNQWFIKVLDQKEQLKAKARECVWHPDYMRLRVEQWIDGLSWDWCVSRQRYFGVPFPIWYSQRAGEEGKILVAEVDQLPVNPLVDLPKGYSREEVIADMDVMDTWATSSISPQLSSHGISGNLMIDAARHKKLFPADLRPQAHEIIRTWAFYTLVKAHLHEDTIPWKNLIISGWCLAADKTKMSKSKGNVVTPVGLLQEHGTDAVRYWASTSRLGSDTAFSEDLLKIGRKLVNKIWNASRFAALQLVNLQGTPRTASADVESGIICETLDLWILTRLQRAINKATEEFHKYEYADARNAAEDFFWNDFCDNYLELVKARSYGSVGDAKAQQSALYTVYHCLNGILKLFAPFVPHITEELYAHIFDEEYAKIGSIHARGNWANAADYPLCEDAETAGVQLVSLINLVRKAKSERNVSIKTPLSKVEIFPASAAAKAGWQKLQTIGQDFQAAANAENLVWTEAPHAADMPLTEDGDCAVFVEFA